MSAQSWPTPSGNRTCPKIDEGTKARAHELEVDVGVRALLAE
jgi:hypothetical protein